MHFVGSEGAEKERLKKTYLHPRRDLLNLIDSKDLYVDAKSIGSTMVLLRHLV